MDRILIDSTLGSRDILIRFCFTNGIVIEIAFLFSYSQYWYKMPLLVFNSLFIIFFILATVVQYVDKPPTDEKYLLRNIVNM
jgi:hypothetical protein